MEAFLLLLLLSLMGVAAVQKHPLGQDDQNPPPPAPLPPTPPPSPGPEPWPQHPPQFGPWPSAWMPDPHLTKAKIDRAWWWLKNGLRWNGPPQTAPESARKLEQTEGQWVQYVATTHETAPPPPGGPSVSGTQYAVEVWVPKPG